MRDESMFSNHGFRRAVLWAILAPFSTNAVLAVDPSAESCDDPRFHCKGNVRNPIKQGGKDFLTFEQFKQFLKWPYRIEDPCLSCSIWMVMKSGRVRFSAQKKGKLAPLNPASAVANGVSLWIHKFRPTDGLGVVNRKFLTVKPEELAGQTTTVKRVCGMRWTPQGAWRARVTRGEPLVFTGDEPQAGFYRVKLTGRNYLAGWIPSIWLKFPDSDDPDLEDEPGGSGPKDVSPPDRATPPPPDPPERERIPSLRQKKEKLIAQIQKTQTLLRELNERAAKLTELRKSLEATRAEKDRSRDQYAEALRGLKEQDLDPPIRAAISKKVKDLEGQLTAKVQEIEKIEKEIQSLSKPIEPQRTQLMKDVEELRDRRKALDLKIREAQDPD